MKIRLTYYFVISQKYFRKEIIQSKVTSISGIMMIRLFKFGIHVIINNRKKYFGYFCNTFRLRNK